jgi:hypothetical protein
MLPFYRIHNRGVCYTEFLGDGDLKDFTCIVDSKPYSEKHCEIGMYRLCTRKHGHTSSGNEGDLWK